MKTLTPEEMKRARALWDAGDVEEFQRFCSKRGERLLATLEEHFAEGTTEPMTEREAYRES